MANYTEKEIRVLAEDHREVAVHFAGRDTESLAMRTADALDAFADQIAAGATVKKFEHKQPNAGGERRED